MILHTHMYNTCMHMYNTLWDDYQDQNNSYIRHLTQLSILGWVARTLKITQSDFQVHDIVL